MPKFLLSASDVYRRLNIRVSDLTRSDPTDTLIISTQQMLKKNTLIILLKNVTLITRKKLSMLARSLVRRSIKRNILVICAR